jgi:hypothetical protein
MSPQRKRTLIIGLTLVLVPCLVLPIWLSLTHQPRFYRAIVQLPHAQQEAKAKRFVAQSLQLRNDICNEPSWEAIFTDQEVNAWLAEDLVTHFADQLPCGVHDPRVVFEIDRATLAFRLDRGPLTSVIWVVAGIRVPEGNVVELTLEKIRAGALPFSADRLIDQITEQARGRGLDIQWKHDGDLPVAVIRYTPSAVRDDVVLEQLQICSGQIRLAGRSQRARGIVSAPTLPTRKVLQSKFPRRKLQAKGVGEESEPTVRNSAVPTS